MKFINKCLSAGLIFAMVFELTSCGAATVGALFCWMRVYDDYFEYVKDSLPDAASDEDVPVYETEDCSVHMSIFQSGEKFKYSFPNKMYEIESDPATCLLDVRGLNGKVQSVDFKSLELNADGKSINLLDQMKCKKSKNDLYYNFEIEYKKMDNDGFESSKNFDTNAYAVFLAEHKMDFASDIDIESFHICCRDLYLNHPQSIVFSASIVLHMKDGTENVVDVGQKFNLVCSETEMYNLFYNRDPEENNLLDL